LTRRGQLMNARQATPSAQLSALLSRFSPEIVALTRRGLSILRRSFPGSCQLVYDYNHSLVVAFGMSERGYDAIVSIAVFPREVRLYFRKSLPDPKRILRGAGTKVRSVSLRTVSDLKHEDIRALIDASVEHSGFTAQPSRGARMIIKSGAKKRKRRTPTTR
jgi:hypothetical protein